MSRKHKKRSSIAVLNQELRRPDLHILGNAVTSLPPSQWQSRMFFMGVPDTDLRARTDEKFPATLRPDRQTHPVFVLRADPTLGHLVCPCSSKGRKNQNRYIRKGCKLEISDHIIDRDSFLIEQYTFTVPLDNRFSRKLMFKGRVPDRCLAGGNTL